MSLKLGAITNYMTGIVKEFDTPPGIVTHINPQTDTRIAEALHSAKIDIRDEIEENPACISLVQNGIEYILGALGDFIAIIGKAKSRKSFLLVIVIAAAIKKVLFGLVKVDLPEGKEIVLLFDTEQSKYYVQLAIKRICKLAGCDYPESLQTYSLRKFSAAERLALIEYAIYNTPGIGIVVIDGIRDLITSINDEDQASMIVSKLLKWTEELGISIIVVLHQNKGDTNARGHVGTELMNKALTALSVTKDAENKNISIVQAEYCRNKEFEPFSFEIDEHGLPFMSDFQIVATAEKKKKITPYDIDDSTHKKQLAEIFKKEPSPKYSDLMSQVHLSFMSCGIELATNRIKEFIKYYNNKGWVSSQKPAGGKYPVYQLNQSV